ncbi:MULTISPECIES: glycosyltransferase family 4 protein [unclassified Nostoc]|uniref:glycosyltransferase family 4 protein n=1 Tax=unclassified Nostoc TaxID=2593658 RepID=UPI002624C915|nr:glycosyltransferase family 4 protein [Nostoc sp. S13]MDF5738740.1 glycosyltransferase family 4 protein [Nostoc sp. S13]
MLKILHIIDTLSSAGPTRSLIAAAKYAAQQSILQQHRVITLQPKVNPFALILAKQADITVFRKPDQQTLLHEIEQADIVQVYFWNNPEMYDFLRAKLPAMRLLMWFQVMGDKPPQIITPVLVEYSDFALASSPCTLELPIFQVLSETLKSQKTSVVYSPADWERLTNLQPRSHENFNVGYIGTVNFAKMHPRYIPISAAITIPDIRFIVCGGGIQATLQQQAIDLGAAEKFDFRGYVENIKPVLETLDIFGYPLCADTYATSEKSLQEAMFAGVPPVVFPYGGVKDLVKHEQTGLVVNSEAEYQQAIEYLYYHPDVRLKLGQNAANYARQVFDSKKAVWQLHQVYDRMMKSPKRQRTWKDSATVTQHPTSASLFVQTLGDSAPQFNISMTAVEREVLLEADAKIANASALLSGGEGGIINYRNSYPNDGYLRLWSGLVLQKQGKHSTALEEFVAAIELGIEHWRVYWYLAQSALQVEDFSTVKTALCQVINAAPNFMEAQVLFQTFQQSPP